MITKLQVAPSHFHLLKKSQLASYATEISFVYSSTRKHIRSLASISLPRLRHVSIDIDADALPLLPRRQWPLLQTLRLTIAWDFRKEEEIDFSAFKYHAKKHWPNLQSIELSIDHDEDALYEAELDGDDPDDLDIPPADLSSASMLLRALPQLKCIKIETSFMWSESFGEWTSIPHAQLESAELTLGCVMEENVDMISALGEAQWPRLQSLKLGDVGHVCIGGGQDLGGALWIKTLKTLHVTECFICQSGLGALFKELSGGALEDLRLANCSSWVMKELKEGEFSNLKRLDVSLERRDEDVVDVTETNEAFEDFFSAHLPALEEVSVGYSYSIPGEWTVRHIWDKAPLGYAPPPPIADADAAVTGIRATTTTEAATTTTTSMWLDVSPLTRPPAPPKPPSLPSLKSITIHGLRIKAEVPAFIARNFYLCGCDVDLSDCSVESGVTARPMYQNTLNRFSVSQSDFDGPLRELGLYGHLYWFNLMSVEDIEAVAAMAKLKKVVEGLEQVRTLAADALESTKFVVGRPLAGGGSTDGGERSVASTQAMLHGQMVDKYNSMVQSIGALRALMP